jgi:LacI family transcriptional regulator
VISNAACVTPEMRARVMRAARDLKYVPNHSARALKLGHTGVIGLLTLPTSDTASEEVVDRFQQLVRAEGKRVMHHSYEAHQIASAVDTALENRWEAVAVNARDYPRTAARLKHLRRMGMSVVILDDPALKEFDRVTYDRHHGVRLLLDHARELGRRRIVVIGTSQEWERPESSRKFKNWHEELAARGLQGVDVISVPTPDVSVPTLFGAARKATDEILQRGVDFDFLICATDAMAAGALSSLLDHGVRVPEAVAVCGYNDEPLAACLRPALTTIQRPQRAMADLAWSILKRRMEGYKGESVLEVLLPRIVVRESTRGRTVAVDNGVRGEDGG